MIAKVSLGGSLSGALGYNQHKVDKEQAKILETNRVFVPADGRFSLAECVRDFERTMPSQVTTTRGIVHISLNPHPDDRLTNEQLTDIGREYIERMGFGGQPWMLFKHEDIDREHLHIVTTRIRPDGALISDKNNFERSRKITDDLEKKYDLHPKDTRQGEGWRLAPVDAAAGDLKRQVGNVVKLLAETYRFHSLPGYRVLLSLYNVGVEKVEGDNKGHRYTGLVYSALDADGNRVGQPLKSSLFGKKYGVAHLEAWMQEVKAKGFPASIRPTVAASLADSGTGGDFRERLRERGIDLVLRYGNGDRLFGATFIDHNSRTVLNGSALGKEFSANALATRFPDLAIASRENRQVLAPPLISLVGEMPRPIGRPTLLSPVSERIPLTGAAAHSVSSITPDSGNYATYSAPESYSASFDFAPAVEPDTNVSAPSLSPLVSAVGEAAGGLLSIFTPEPGPASDNGPAMPKPKKKKPQYRQKH